MACLRAGLRSSLAELAAMLTRLSSGGAGPGAGGAAGAVEVAGERVSHRLLDDGRGLQHSVEIQAGRHPRPLEEVDDLLGGDVSAGAGRERAAAQPAD